MPKNGTTSLLEREAILREMDESLNRAVASGASVSAVVCDIDRFRHLLAERGDAASQDIVDQVGHALAEAFGDEMLIGRMTADEFLAVGPELSSETAADKANEARKAVEAMDLPITLSAGVAAYPSDSQSRNGLLHKAAEALNRAKQSGKNCVRRAADGETVTRTFRLPKSQAKRLTDLARQTGKDESTLLQESVDQFLSFRGA